MTALATPRSVADDSAAGAAPSPAGPVDDATPTRLPPGLGVAPALQGLRFGMRPMGFNLGAAARFGDVWELRLPTQRKGFVVSSHPDHLRSLLPADPGDAPSLTGESPLRPILGPNSILTSVGARHLRQRRLLLPPFHGEAVQRYVEMISEVADREIEHRMRETIRRLLAASTHPLFRLVELRNTGRAEARGVLARMLAFADRQMYAVIRARRAAADRERRGDVLSLLLAARDEHGEPLTDHELRDELMSLVLAGHETTANSLAWTFERLLRTPTAWDRLRELVRGPDRAAADAYVEATINEGMRNRPVIPMIVRMVKRPWRFGEYVLPADTPVAVSIVALHHREDVYPEPFAFRPERFVGTKPGTYTWIPFGGGIRRCLGASLAMAEQRVVLEAIARRTDLVAPDPTPEPARMRNVTMIPRGGCRVTVTGVSEH